MAGLLPGHFHFSAICIANLLNRTLRNHRQSPWAFALGVCGYCVDVQRAHGRSPAQISEFQLPTQRRLPMRSVGMALLCAVVCVWLAPYMGPTSVLAQSPPTA